MSVLSLGGWVMWPLLGLSVLAVAVACERAWFYASLGFPRQGADEKISRALLERDNEALWEMAPFSSPVFADFFEELRSLLAGSNAGDIQVERNAALTLMAETSMARMEKNLGILGLIVRAAPLLGLLGTVLGMINTFSRLSDVNGGVDLAILSEGIWQALITTAAGLLIAIPTLLAQHWFQSRRRRTAAALRNLACALVLARRGAGRV